MNKKRDGRRGMAMELAMLVMVVTFALSLLLTTFALMQANQKKIDLRDTKEKIALEQIGEDYLAACKSGNLHELSDDQGDYEIVTKAPDSLVVRRKADNEIALTIELQDGKITKWELN
jgi:hypothetical protein